MNILVLNGSPKGKNSVTLQTAIYLQKKNPEHTVDFFNVGQRIKSIEKNFDEAKQKLEAADLILFAYPVYTFLAPYQLHRFIELIKEHAVVLQGKFASQITTSKHFYDITAHKYIEENCYDLSLKYIDGLSADMDDLLKEKGQNEAQSYFDKMMFDIENDIYKKSNVVYNRTAGVYKNVLKDCEKSSNKDVLIVTNAADDDLNLQNMIADFRATLPYKSREINIRKFEFKGGCLGCFNCSISGNCIYKDGFEDFLREDIQKADSIIYAFTIENHYTHSSFKCYEDRHFCNGHRAVTHGMPVGYIIAGDYTNERNIQVLVEGRSEVGGVYLCGVANDQIDEPTKSIVGLAKTVAYALTHKMSKSSNFYAIGGNKIFRDLVYTMRGMMKEDHRFFKKHGLYDFPHKKRAMILQGKLVGLAMSNKKMRTKMKGKMTSYVVMPYQKVIDSIEDKQQASK